MSRNGTWHNDTVTFDLGDSTKAPSKRQQQLLTDSLNLIMKDDNPKTAQLQPKLILGKWKSDKSVDMDYMNKILGKYIEAVENQDYDFNDDLVMQANRKRPQYFDWGHFSTRGRIFQLLLKKQGIHFSMESNAQTEQACFRVIKVYDLINSWISENILEMPWSEYSI